MRATGSVLVTVKTFGLPPGKGSFGSSASKITQASPAEDDPDGRAPLADVQETDSGILKSKRREELRRSGENEAACERLSSQNCLSFAHVSQLPGGPAEAKQHRQTLGGKIGQRTRRTKAAIKRRWPLSGLIE